MMTYSKQRSGEYSPTHNKSQQFIKRCEKHPGATSYWTSECRSKSRSNVAQSGNSDRTAPNDAQHSSAFLSVSLAKHLPDHEMWYAESGA
jgi:hypothetical protein